MYHSIVSLYRDVIKLPVKFFQMFSSLVRNIYSNQSITALWQPIVLGHSIGKIYVFPSIVQKVKQYLFVEVNPLIFMPTASSAGCRHKSNGLGWEGVRGAPPPIT